MELRVVGFLSPTYVNCCMPVVDEAEKNGKINASTSLGMGIWNDCKRIVLLKELMFSPFQSIARGPQNSHRGADRQRKMANGASRSKTPFEGLPAMLQRTASHRATDYKYGFLRPPKKKKKVKPPSLKTFSHERYTVWVSQKGATTIGPETLQITLVFWAKYSGRQKCDLQIGSREFASL